MSRNRTENPNIAADRIDILEEHEIFVFGSNLAGRHGGGAARAANMKFGASDWKCICGFSPPTQPRPP